MATLFGRKVFLLNPHSTAIMYTHTQRSHTAKSQAPPKTASAPSPAAPAASFRDNRPENAVVAQLQQAVDVSEQVAQLQELEEMVNESPQAEKRAVYQAMADSFTNKNIPAAALDSNAPIQRYIDPITGEENGEWPIGMVMGGLAPQGEDNGGFSIGRMPELTRFEKRQRRLRRLKERKKEREKAAAKLRQKKFEQADVTLPEHLTPVTLDIHSVEAPDIRNFTADANRISDYKAKPLGVKITLPGKRAVDLGNTDDDIISNLVDHSTWYLGDDILWADAQGPDLDFIAKFDTNDVAKLEVALHIKFLILNEEAHPRSGIGRAAPDDQMGEREPAKNEAMYSPPKTGILHHVDSEPDPASKHIFTSKHNGNTIEARIIHRGPWAKGVRDPGQSDVMGGQNAKNYLVDHLFETEDKPFEKYYHKKELGGRWEWLHLIGSSLGGPNTANNLVAGSYDANTKMIALEHRVALWGAQGYEKEFRPTAHTPIEIITIAEVEPAGTHVGKTIRMEVLHGGERVVTGEYQAMDKAVLTKSEYRQEEGRVDDAVEHARGARQAGPADPTRAQGGAGIVLADAQHPEGHRPIQDDAAGPAGANSNNDMNE